jgi:hypothetical protein
MSDVVLSPGQSATAFASPVDSKGSTTCYVKGTLYIWSNNPSVFTVSRLDTEQQFKVTAVGWGTGSGGIKITSHDGTTRTKNFTVDVACNEIADIKITFTK